MKKKRKINIPRIIWVTGLFALLIVILLMIIDYKVNYEYLEKKFLYFYDCSGSVCTSQVNSGFSKDILYSTYECDYEVCPELKKVLNDDYVMLQKDKKNILYDYKNNKIISDSYENYYPINDKYFIVTLNKYQGMIDSSNNILISISYDELGYKKDELLIGYNTEKIIAKKKDLYGIVSIKTEEVLEKFNYKEEDINTLLEIINS